MTKLATDKKKQFGPLVRWLKVNFSECYIAWIHVKVGKSIYLNDLYSEFLTKPTFIRLSESSSSLCSGMDFQSISKG